MIIKFYSYEDLSFFPIYLYAIGIDYLQEKIVRPSGFEHHHLFLIERGEGDFILDGKVYHTKPNDMIYIPPNVPHTYFGTTNDFTTSYIAFFGDSVYKIKSYYGIGDYGVYRDKGVFKFKKNLNELADRLKRSNKIAPLCSLTLSTVIDFFEAVCEEKPSPIEAVYNYIVMNYEKPLTLDDIMTIYPYSKSTLCRDFKKIYKTSIFEMITDLRLKKAYHIISISPNVHSKKVAEECGFNDASYFCKMYKKKYGTSPKDRNN